MGLDVYLYDGERDLPRELYKDECHLDHYFTRSYLRSSYN